MLTSVQAGPYSIRGVSVGGVYTALHVPELGVSLDVGLAPRSFAAARALFLSHGHVDHTGALATMLGIRALIGHPQPLRVFFPAEMADPLAATLAAVSRLQGYPLEIEPVPLAPGDEVEVRGDLRVQAFRTQHPVPSLGYQFLRRVDKLRPEFAALSGPEIAARRRAGEELLESVDRLELAYVTDTLIEVLDDRPALLESRVLLLECTFLDDRKPYTASRAGYHTHLDDLLDRADRFANQHIVLTHLSQIYKPGEVVDILDRRCPAGLRSRITPFIPKRTDWPG